jgi:glucose-6-phosphate-specific signal transduction histidine kinase
VSPIDALIHLVNFFLPAVVVAALAAALAKLMWRRELKSVAWRRLAVWAAIAAAAALVTGLLLFGRDGKMATYGLMLLTCAAALAWAGWGPRRVAAR